MTSTSGRRVAIVNVASTAARVSRPNSGAYSASKFALAGWNDALHNEEAPHGIHVGLVLPGFIKTEGFPAAELLANPATRWIVSRPERVAEAIVEAGPGRQGRALRPPALLAGGGAPDPDPRARPPRDRGRWAHHRHLDPRRLTYTGVNSAGPIQGPPDTIQIQELCR